MNWQNWMNEVEAMATDEEREAAASEAEKRVSEYGGAYIDILAEMLGKNCPDFDPMDAGERWDDDY